jgi:hypothetical protein
VVDAWNRHIDGATLDDTMEAIAKAVGGS